MRATRLALLSIMLVGVAGCADDHPADWDEHVVISGGGMAGIYYGYGAELATAMSERLGVTAEVTETGGSIENLHDLAAGTSMVGFSAADAAADAVAGRPPFEEALPVQAMARVYDDFVHLIVPADSPISAVEDLPGRDVSLGGAGSGTELIANRLLAAAGVDRAEIDNAALGIDGSIEAMRAGKLDGFFWSGGLPTPGVSELADELPIRLIDLGDLVEIVHTEHGGSYRHGVVPRGTYGLDEDVVTMAVPNYLMVRADTSADLVYDLVWTLFDERATIAEHAPAAGLLTSVRAIFTEPVELHPGALRYYRDEKL